MINITFVTYFSFKKIRHHKIHSAGPDLYFSKPCIGYLKKGCAKFLYEGKCLYAVENDLIYIPQGTKYQSIWSGYPDIEWYSISFDFKAPHGFGEYPFQILKNYPSKLPDEMYEVYEASHMLALSLFYKLLDDISGKMKTSQLKPSYTGILPAIEYIENNYNKSFSINELSGICFCSESGFFRLFKRATGVTPIAYKHNIMIQHAVDMLTNTRLPIEEISTRTGFSSSNYFRRVFEKSTGKTPKEIRNKL